MILSHKIVHIKSVLNYIKTGTPAFFKGEYFMLLITLFRKAKSFEVIDWPFCLKKNIFVWK